LKLFSLADLRERDSVRFPLDERTEGFAVRVGDEVRAYVNICPHRAQPVDVGDGRLWVGAEIECQAHGARFDPLTGACRGGPCDGRPLTALTIEERDGQIWGHLAVLGTATGDSYR
jgi:nitrite reductase/ring-hydroxylating ferredoxin subunit